jgi:hypothetical protein
VPKRSEKKPESARLTARVVPMELQIGDLLTDETGEGEIVAARTRQ